MKSSLAPFLCYFFVVLLFGCRTSQAELLKAEGYVENCRKDWVFIDLKEAIELKIIHVDRKGHYDLSAWPNFFIGVNSQGDTIGVIDNFSDKEFKEGENVIFGPHHYENLHKAFHLKPNAINHKSKKLNKLYCSVKLIYYGKLI